MGEGRHLSWLQTVLRVLMWMMSLMTCVRCLTPQVSKAKGQICNMGLREGTDRVIFNSTFSDIKFPDGNKMINLLVEATDENELSAKPMKEVCKVDVKLEDCRRREQIGCYCSQYVPSLPAITFTVNMSAKYEDNGVYYRLTISWPDINSAYVNFQMIPTIYEKTVSYLEVKGFTRFLSQGVQCNIDLRLDNPPYTFKFCVQNVFYPRVAMYCNSYQKNANRQVKNCQTSECNVLSELGSTFTFTYMDLCNESDTFECTVQGNIESAMSIGITKTSQLALVVVGLLIGMVMVIYFVVVVKNSLRFNRTSGISVVDSIDLCQTENHEPAVLQAVLPAVQHGSSTAV